MDRSFGTGSGRRLSEFESDDSSDDSEIATNQKMLERPDPMQSDRSRSSRPDQSIAAPGANQGLTGLLLLLAIATMMIRTSTSPPSMSAVRPPPWLDSSSCR